MPRTRNTKPSLHIGPVDIVWDSWALKLLSFRLESNYGGTEEDDNDGEEGGWVVVRAGGRERDALVDGEDAEADEWEDAEDEEGEDGQVE